MVLMLVVLYTHVYLIWLKQSNGCSNQMYTVPLSLTFRTTSSHGLRNKINKLYVQTKVLKSIKLQLLKEMNGHYSTWNNPLFETTISFAQQNTLNGWSHSNMLLFSLWKLTGHKSHTSTSPSEGWRVVRSSYC